MIWVPVQPGKKYHYVVILEHSKYLVYTLEKSLIILTFRYFPVLAAMLSSEYKGEGFLGVWLVVVLGCFFPVFWVCLFLSYSGWGFSQPPKCIDPFNCQQKYV